LHCLLTNLLYCQIICQIQCQSFFDFKNVLSLFRIACLMHFSLLIHFFVKLAINVRLDAQLFIVRYLQRYSVVFLILFLYLHYHCSLVLLRIKDLFIID